MERKLTAILSADVKGYSRLMGEDEEATIRTLTAYREVLATLIAQHRGRVVDSPGDNVLAEFASAVDAVRGAVEIQRELRVRNAELPPERQMEFRIGLNVGDVVVEGERLYGDGVNIAARLESLAEPGGICIAGTVYDQVENKLSLGYKYAGEQTVKNIARPVRVYRVVEHEAPAPPPEQGEEPAPLLPLPDKPSIIVLPFANLSQDPEQDYFSDGITEDITTDLSKIASLFVISRHSAFTYKGKARKINDISREMGVRYALEGSVRRAGNQVRISAQLIDATTDQHLWAERYDRELQDIFTLQDEIAQQVVFALKVTLSPEEHLRFRRYPTPNLNAYDIFLRGLGEYYRFTQETNIQARQLFEQAIALDPAYGAACAFVGLTYWTGWIFQWEQSAQALEQACIAAQKAVALDDSLAEAHMILALVFVFQKHHEQAIAEAKRAIVLDPNFAEAYWVLGFISNFAGQPSESIEAIDTAMRLNPRYPPYYLFDMGKAYWLVGQYEKAIVAQKKALAINRDFLAAHLYLIAAYDAANREEEARAQTAEILRLSPNFSLEVFGQRLPYKDQAISQRLLVALRKAGLK